MPIYLYILHAHSSINKTQIVSQNSNEKEKLKFKIE